MSILARSPYLAVLRKDGAPKLTKKGRPIERRLSAADESKPLPNRKCGKCGVEIKVGDPYKWVAPKSGPYGGSKKFRCGPCPDWRHWELSSSKMAEIWQAQEECGIENVASVDDVRAALDVVVEAARSVGEQYQESADNIEEGFGHATSMSEDLAEKASEIGGWADDLEGWDPPDGDEFEADDEADPDETEEERVERVEQAEQDWLDEMRSSAEEAINECPG